MTHEQVMKAITYLYLKKTITNDDKMKAKDKDSLISDFRRKLEIGSELCGI
jgi:hypothetical protein